MALIGENGAGKSTLMKILGGVIERDAGEIRLDGEIVEILSPRDASRRGIEFIHQELSVLDNFDVAANIFLRREPTKGGWLKLIDSKRLYRDADVLLKRLGLEISSRTPLARLSLAQQQLVEIARAISTGARILIMDEPTFESDSLPRPKRCWKSFGTSRHMTSASFTFRTVFARSKRLPIEWWCSAMDITRASWRVQKSRTIGWCG